MFWAVRDQPHPVSSFFYYQSQVIRLIFLSLDLAEADGWLYLLRRSLCAAGVFCSLVYHSALIILFSEAFLSLALSFPIFLLSIFSCLPRTKACSCCFTVCGELAKDCWRPLWFLPYPNEWWRRVLVLLSHHQRRANTSLRCKEAHSQALEESEHLFSKEHLPFMKTQFWLFSLQSSFTFRNLVH